MQTRRQPPPREAVTHYRVLYRYYYSSTFHVKQLADAG